MIVGADGLRLRTLIAVVSGAGLLAACASDEPRAPTTPSRTISIEVQTPDPAWSIDLVDARLVEGEVWAVWELSRREGAAPQVISSAADMATISARPDAPVRRFVVGRTWQWEDRDAGIRFIGSVDELGEEFRAGLSVYP